MGKLVTPEVYFIGYTTINMPEMQRYLIDTGNEDFLDSMLAAKSHGMSDGEILTSFYAKLCYASLSLGKNDNVTRIRDIPDNLKATWDQGHGSVWEHVSLNFVVHNCSRVYEVEQVRHRAGAAYSILSGRYSRTGEVDLVLDPILEPVRSRLQKIQGLLENHYWCMVKEMKLDETKDHTTKKKITSALRRILPQGKSTEVGFSLNLRALRHIVQLRTSKHAEWEIRHIYGRLYNLIKDKYPLLFYGAKEEIIDGLIEVSGMRIQPYEKTND